MANTLANPIVAPLLLFGGLFIKNSRIPVYFFWLKYLSWFYYAAENMMIGQWTFEKDTFYCSLPANVRLAREEAERDVQFAEVAQTFHRSNLNCNVSGKNYGVKFSWVGTGRHQKSMLGEKPFFMFFFSD